MTFSCNCICVLSPCFQESFLWRVVSRRFSEVVFQHLTNHFRRFRGRTTHRLQAQRKGKALRFGRILCEHSHAQRSWAACVLLFSCIFCFCPHMFSPWLLSSLGLYAIMLLGNCRRRTRSVGCVRLGCEEHGGVADE